MESVEKTPERDRKRALLCTVLLLSTSAIFVLANFVSFEKRFGQQVLLVARGRRPAESAADVYSELTTSFLPPLSVLIPASEEEMQVSRSRRQFELGERGLRRNGRNGHSIASRERARRAQAKAMLAYLDPLVDPCDDFYQFACGNWAHVHPIPPDQAGFDVFEIVREELDYALKELLERQEAHHDGSWSGANRSKSHNSDEATGAIGKVRALYRSCMNEAVLQRRGHAPLMDVLMTLGGWPIVQPAWNGSAFDWVAVMARLKSYNNDILLSQWIGPDITNSLHLIVQFDQTTLGLPSREYFLHSSNRVYLDAYKSYLAAVASIIAEGNQSDANVINIDATNIINFEVKLAGITSKPEDRRNLSGIYNKLTLKELCERYPRIDFKRYLEIVLNRTLEEDEKVVFFGLKYAKDLSQLIEATDPRVVCNYLIWRFVRHRVNNLDDRFLEAEQKFFRALFGRQQSPPRWKSCVAQVNSNMGMAVGSMFVSRHFDEYSKDDTLQMTRLIQTAFKRILNGTSWIDSRTRALSEHKLDSMLLTVGYPNFILDLEQLDDYYADIDISEDTYFENTLNILRYTAFLEQDPVGKHANKSDWNTAPAVVNAYYSRNKNQILFPAGILQPPFYHRHFPRSLNYGGIGAVIGHEITHGFDDRGHTFDENGNLVDWWNDNVSDEFHSRTQCLISQYGRYVVDEVDLAVDGISTQGENIADNGGLKQAYQAYSAWLSEQGDASLEDETLEGIPLTPQQLFFLNFAQVWCGALRPEATRSKLKSSAHSPGRFRVIGTLSNMEAFAEAFDCVSGSPTNPADKCVVW